jgi:hypothetical protein
MVFSRNNAVKKKRAATLSAAMDGAQWLLICHKMQDFLASG